MVILTPELRGFYTSALIAKAAAVIFINANIFFTTTMFSINRVAKFLICSVVFK